eukprot:2926066-Prymnesium_polylepis.1
MRLEPRTRGWPRCEVTPSARTSLAQAAGVGQIFVRVRAQAVRAPLRGPTVPVHQDCARTKTIQTK